LLVGLVLEADAAERKRFGYRVERGLRDRDADHASNAGAFGPARPHYAITVSRGHFAQSERLVLDHSELLAQTGVLSLPT
jgi:hypothetical protein